MSTIEPFSPNVLIDTCTPPEAGTSFKSALGRVTLGTMEAVTGYAKNTVTVVGSLATLALGTDAVTHFMGQNPEWFTKFNACGQKTTISYSVSHLFAGCPEESGLEEIQKDWGAKAVAGGVAALGVTLGGWLVLRRLEKVFHDWKQQL